jgi:hypothetical protein
MLFISQLIISEIYMKPFNLEDARNGKPIEVYYGDGWSDAIFIGASPVCDGIAYHPIGGDYPASIAGAHIRNVRMKSRVLYVNIYDAHNDPENPYQGRASFAFEHEKDAKENAIDNDYNKLLAIAVPVEV